ncbi:hypothetical protein [Hylemonella gracilis]|uniref:hypothetical protein n=1 Tax=Hylemonella gracilis TaxID=80880 RepID=UPI001110E2CF|nr:hypothetical protein [Hylemonella gracilis]
MGAYIWGQELNAALSPLLSMVEVVLRNSIHVAASAQFSTPRWYQDVLKNEGDLQFPLKVAANATLLQRYYRPGVRPHHKRMVWIGGHQKYLTHWRSQSEARLDEITHRLTQNGKPQTPDQIVAHAMFGFWLGILGPTFESTTDPLALWPNCLAATFPNDPSMTRARAHQLLARIKGLRNRVSHHEPAWRLANPLTPAGVNATLTVRVSEMRELLNAMTPDINQLLANAGLYDRLSWLLDPRTIAAFAGQHAIAAVDLRSLSRKVRKLARQAHRSAAAPVPQPGRAVALHHAGKTLMTVVPHF